MTSTLTLAKRSLRTTIKKQLRTLSPDSISTQSEKCTQSLLALPEYVAARSISIFLSMPHSEISTTALLTHALSAGKRVYVPYIHRNLPSMMSSLAENTPAPPSLMDMLSLSSVDDFDGLERDSWGIPTISEATRGERTDVLDEQGEELDMVVMPGVAFDESFGRLGHGKGYYDYWLARYNNEKGRTPVLVALGFKEQVRGKEEIPMDESDWRVDVVLTGDGRCLRKAIESGIGSAELCAGVKQYHYHCRMDGIDRTSRQNLLYGTLTVGDIYLTHDHKRAKR